MLPNPLPPVNPACASRRPSWRREVLTIALLFGLSALLLWLLNLDTPLARTVYTPNTGHDAYALATFLRRYSTWPGAAMALAGLAAMLWPRVWRTHPLLYRLAIVTTFTAVLGVGLVNQILVKNLADRPRPHESILTSTTPAADTFRGNSMPSGHAAMGFLLAAPFFPLRQHRPRLAAASLASGLIVGSLIGLSRMALGAHYATDILIAGLITLASAAIFNHLARQVPRIPHKLIALGTVACTLAVILGNRFTGLTLTLPLTTPLTQSSLPCALPSNLTLASPVPLVPGSLLTVRISGYGAPLSQLKLTANQGHLHLQTHLGLYHHLTCNVSVAPPAHPPAKPHFPLDIPRISP